MTRPFAGDTNRMHVWLTRSDGHLVSAWQDSGNNWHWSDHGLLPAATAILSGVSYEIGGDHHERVYFVGTDGLLYEYDLVNGTSSTLYSYGAPSGRTFTQQVAALTGVYSGTQYVALVLTMTDQSMWTVVGYASAHGLYFYNRGSGYDTLAQLAATVSPDETIWTFFGRQTDGTAEWVRWTGSTWATGNAGSPPGADVGRSMAAAQGWLSDTTYAFHLWTTPSPPLSLLRVLRATSPSSTSFSWTYTNVGGLPDGEYSLAATARPYGFGPSHVALDGFTLASGRIYRDTRSIDSWPWSAEDLGTGEEVSGNSPSVAAMSTGFGYSRVAWVGELGDARHLYSRAADFGPDDLWRFLAHGQGVPRRQINAGAGVPHTEVMADEWQGNVLAAAIVRPDGPGPDEQDYAYVQAMWSDDDGETWGPPVTMPSSVGGFSYNHVSDPVVTFTSGGTAYVGLLGVNFAGNCAAGSNQRAFYFTTTTDGTSYTTPVMIEGGGGAFNAMDHGWVDIDRSGPADRLHFVWANQAVRYRCMDEGVTCPSTSTDCCMAPCSTPPCLGPVRDLSTAWALGSGFPTLSVGGDGGVYVSWFSNSSMAVLVCRLNASLSACETTPFQMFGNLKIDISAVPIPGTTNGYIRADQAWSIAAGQRTVCPQACPDCGVLYYAFHRLESDGTEKDVYASRGVYCKSTQTWTWSLPTAVPAVTDDDTDQFNPTITVLSDGRSGYFDDTVFVSWYDRRQTCIALPPNRCLQMWGAISRNVGLSFTTEHLVQNGSMTDPWLLPFHCRDPVNQRFIGDYHEHAGNLLHSHYIWSAAPEGGAPRTGELWHSFISFGHFSY